MKINVNGHNTYVSTGGRPFDKAHFDQAPSVLLFIHGSGQSHLSYILQGRFFANRGWPVIVADMPGHGLSEGAALTSIHDMADWYNALLEVLNIKQAIVIGHSQGGLVALEMAKRYQNRVKGLGLVATALAIPVNDSLLDMAKNNEPQAINAMTNWGHGALGHRHDHTLPGQNHIYYGRQLMTANQKGALYADLNACATYSTGKEAAQNIICPVICILAQHDKMTPVKFGKKMADILQTTPVIVENAGHMLPSEHPNEVNIALRNFFESIDNGL